VGRFLNFSILTEGRSFPEDRDRREEGFRCDVRKRCALSPTKLDRTTIVAAKVRKGVETNVVVEDDPTNRRNSNELPGRIPYVGRRRRPRRET